MGHRYRLVGTNSEEALDDTACNALVRDWKTKFDWLFDARDPKGTLHTHELTKPQSRTVAITRAIVKLVTASSPIRASQLFPDSQASNAAWDSQVYKARKGLHKEAFHHVGGRQYECRPGDNVRYAVIVGADPSKEDSARTKAPALQISLIEDPASWSHTEMTICVVKLFNGGPSDVHVLGARLEVEGYPPADAVKRRTQRSPGLVSRKGLSDGGDFDVRSGRSKTLKLGFYGCYADHKPGVSSSTLTFETNVGDTTAPVRVVHSDADVWDGTGI